MKRGIAVDLGTANTLVYYKTVGVVIDEPSLAAVRVRDHKVMALGQEARELLLRDPDGLTAIRPVKDGVIADYTCAQALLEYMIRKVIKQRLFDRPEVILAVPEGVSEVETRALVQIARRSGAEAGKLFFISEPVASAIGAGLPVSEAKGSFIVDIGGGTTQMAAVTLGGSAASRLIHTAGIQMDEAIASYIKNVAGIEISPQTAEQVKIAIGSAYVSDKTVEEKMIITGLDPVSGKTRNVEVTNFHIAEALYSPVEKIIDAVKETLEQTPPELASDIFESGIVLSGGGAQLKGLTEILTKATGLKTRTAEDPQECVIHGAGMVLEDPQKYRGVLSPIQVFFD